jgi:hypothetical protein
LLVNVATSSGTVGVEDQFVPTFQLVPGPVQVPLVIMSPLLPPALRAAAPLGRLIFATCWHANDSQRQ